MFSAFTALVLKSVSQPISHTCCFLPPKPLAETWKSFSSLHTSLPCLWRWVPGRANLPLGVHHCLWWVALGKGLFGWWKFSWHSNGKWTRSCINEIMFPYSYLLLQNIKVVGLLFAKLRACGLWKLRGSEGTSSSMQILHSTRNEVWGEAWGTASQRTYGMSINTLWAQKANIGLHAAPNKESQV